MKTVVNHKTGKGIKKTDACTLHMADGQVLIKVRETPNGDVLVTFEEWGIEGPKVFIGYPDSDGNVLHKLWKEE